MKFPLKYLLAILILIVIGVLTTLFIANSKFGQKEGNSQTQQVLEGQMGLTPEQASQIEPFVQEIKLSVRTTTIGVLLEWEPKSNITVDYFDVHKKPSGTIDWGEMINRVVVSNKQNNLYNYLDKDTTNGNSYEYQIIGVKLSGKYEIKEEASNIVEVDF